MPDFKRLFFSTPTPSEDGEDNTRPLKKDGQPSDLTFTNDQVATMYAALGLAPEASADDFVAKILEVAESAHDADSNRLDSSLNQEDVQRIAASAAREAIAITNPDNNVIIDKNVWDDMKRNMDIGLASKRQQHRLEAEAVVDQAIRLSKASAAERENWIAAYNADKEATVKALNAAAAIPRIEIGHSLTLEQLEERQRNNWVR